MGIYIEGMEMPKVEFGSVIVAIRPDGMVEDVMGCYVGKAVPVSPHGDLIDRDSLKKQLEYVASLEWNQRVGASSGIECAIDMLDDAQTIIPAEVGET